MIRGSSTLVQRLVAMAAIVAMLVALAWLSSYRAPHDWTPGELATLQSLWLDSLPPLPADPSNAVADDPIAAALGQRLFFDTRLSGNGAVACSTCHQPARNFTDGLPRARAIGQSRRNTPSIVGTAYSPFLYWDGRRDSQWSQALSPLEDPVEHGSNRMAIARLIHTDAGYRASYDALFGPPPDLTDRQRFPADASPLGNAAERSAWQAMAVADRRLVNTMFANVGKALAAYERRLLPAPSRFDAYVEALVNGNGDMARATFSDAEARGLRTFIGRGNCTQCHNGPLLTNNEFHNTGVLTAPLQQPDRGRAAGLRELQADPFNCLGEYSDDPARHCPELEFARTGPELLGAVRTPSLRNLAGTEPYMHQGQVPDLAATLAHYDRAAAALIGHNEAKPLQLGGARLADLLAFLQTLATPLSPGSGASE